MQRRVAATGGAQARKRQARRQLTNCVTVHAANITRAETANFWTTPWFRTGTVSPPTWQGDAVCPAYLPGRFYGRWSVVDPRLTVGGWAGTVGLIGTLARPRLKRSPRRLACALPRAWLEPALRRLSPTALFGHLLTIAHTLQRHVRRVVRWWRKEKKKEVPSAAQGTDGVREKPPTEPEPTTPVTRLRDHSCRCRSRARRKRFYVGCRQCLLFRIELQRVAPA